MKAKTQIGLLLAISLVLGGIFMRPAQVNADDMSVLKFGTMVGVPKALTGAQSPIRGVNGGGLPWVINGADGKLSASGELTIHVNGLVLDPTDPIAIARGIGNTNPISSFRALVSCQTASGGIVNIMTDAFPATTGLVSAGGGNAEIETMISLPHPCIAPILFVTSPGGAWFATTGN